MPTPVLEVYPQYSLTHEIRYDTFVVTMGDGFEQRVNKNLTFGNRGDGEGGNGNNSYKGINAFTVTLNKFGHINFDGNGNRAPATYLWNFYKARLGSYEAFYFYNPAEATYDATGNNTQGRYLVRFAESGLSRELFVLKLYNHEIKLIEVRA